MPFGWNEYIFISDDKSINWERWCEKKDVKDAMIKCIKYLDFNLYFCISNNSSDLCSFYQVDINSVIIIEGFRNISDIKWNLNGYNLSNKSMFGEGKLYKLAILFWTRCKFYWCMRPFSWNLSWCLQEVMLHDRLWHSHYYEQCLYRINRIKWKSRKSFLYLLFSKPFRSRINLEIYWLKYEICVITIK